MDYRRKDELVLGGFPDFIVSSMGQEAETSLESHERLAVCGKQRRPSGERLRFTQMVFEI